MSAGAFFDRPELRTCSPRELAELVWLARAWSSEALPRAADPETDDTDHDASPEVDPARSTPATTFDAAFDASDPDGTAATESSGTSGNVVRETRWAHRLPGLSLQLLHARALHCIAPIRTEPGRLEIDADASVRLTAASRALQLVLAPVRARHARLLLIVDRAGQMAPWRRVVDDYAKLAVGVGTFRAVEVVELDASDARRARFRRRGADLDLEHVARSGMDHVCLVISDGVGPAFRSGALGGALRKLPEGTRVAWVHPWPERYWWRSAYARLRGGKPAAVSGRASSLAVPVVELDPIALATLEPWVHGRSASGLRGVTLPASSPASGAWSQRVPQFEEPSQMRRLLGSLAPATVRLLAIAAAVPGRVDLELLLALGRELGEVGRYELAEAIGAGFFERVESDDATVVLRFRSPRARALLLGYLAEDDLERVLRFVLEHCENAPAAGETRARALQIPVGILRRILDGDEQASASTTSEQAYEGFPFLTAMVPDARQLHGGRAAQKAAASTDRLRRVPEMSLGLLRPPYDDPKLRDRARLAFASLTSPSPEATLAVRDFSRALVAAMRTETAQVEERETPPRAEKIRSNRELRARLVEVGIADRELQSLVLEYPLGKMLELASRYRLYDALPRWLAPLRMHPASPEHVERVRAAFAICPDLWTKYRALLDAGSPAEEASPVSKLFPETIPELLNAIGGVLAEDKLRQVAVERGVERAADVNAVIASLQSGQGRKRFGGGFESRLAGLLQRLLSSVLESQASLPSPRELTLSLFEDPAERMPSGIEALIATQLDNLEDLRRIMLDEQLRQAVLQRVGSNESGSAGPELVPRPLANNRGLVFLGANARAIAVELQPDPTPESGWRRLVTAADVMQRDAKEWSLWVPVFGASVGQWRPHANPAVLLMPEARVRQMFIAASRVAERLDGQRPLVMPRVTRIPYATFLPADVIPSDTLLVFPTGTFALLAVLQSRVFLAWATEVSARLHDAIRLTTSVVESFPLPGLISDPLEYWGRELDRERARVAEQEGRSVGAVWRSVVDESGYASYGHVAEVRDELDRAVLRAYGWGDIELDDLREMRRRLGALHRSLT